MGAQDFIFGYGSLVLAPGRAPSRTPDPGGYVCDLAGHARSWGVAMDNTRDLPGYKHYLTPDGTRPPVYVAFLDIAQRPGATVNGVCTPVDRRLLAMLDARERNYDRVDVTDHLAAPLGRTWAYAGSAAGRARFADGVARGSSAVSADYLRAVATGFAALGGHEHERAAPSLAPGALPVRALRRVDRPASSRRPG